MPQVTGAMAQVKRVRDKLRLLLGRSAVVVAARDSKGLYVDVKILYKTSPEQPPISTMTDGVRTKVKKVYQHKGKG